VAGRNTLSGIFRKIHHEVHEEHEEFVKVHGDASKHMSTSLNQVAHIMDKPVMPLAHPQARKLVQAILCTISSVSFVAFVVK